MSTKRKFSTQLGQPAVRPNAKAALKENLNDARAVVSRGGAADQPAASGSAEVIEISSDSSSGEEEEEEEEEVDEDDLVAEADVPNGKDVDMGDAEDVDGRKPESPVVEQTEEQEEPSFGDLILANNSEPIEVAGAFDDTSLRSRSYPQSTKLQPPSGASLGTVLTQALKTNDLALLESCLQTPDIATIRATIQRLDSPLAGTLLQKLAERLHKRPGRAGSLMVWVQWTLVTHGGYLATQPDLIKKLAELNRVIDERARGLQSLLSLKGKLDMLEAQIQLRRSMRKQRQLQDEDDEEGVIYVEGQEDDASSSGADSHSLPNGSKARARQVHENGNLSEGESDKSEIMPLVTSNGIIADSDDGEDSEEGDLIDDEAEETDAESEDEDDVDHSDVDDLEEEDESDDAAPARAAPPTKLQKVGGLFSKRG